MSQSKTDFYKEQLYKYAERFRDKKLEKRGLKVIDKAEPVYVMYLRRSTKAKDKQVRSHKQQQKACEAYARQKGLKIAAIIREKETASKSDVRPEFKIMIDNIQRGELYNSILCWHPDRLARNMKDAGEIIDLLDRGIIKNLEFGSYTFTNDTNGKMALGIQFVLAKQYSDNISQNTTRGMSDHSSIGKSLGKNKFGYKIVDSMFRPVTREFLFLRQAWLYTIEGFSSATVIEELNKRPELKVEITPKNLNRVFADPFYAGFYTFGNTLVELKKVDPKFDPVVSYEEFLRARKVIDSNHFRKKTNPDNPLFKGMLVCDHCNRLLGTYVAKGNTRRYFLIECRNKNCPKWEIKPKVQRTIRGLVVWKFIEDLLGDHFEVNKKGYDYYIEEVKKYVNTEYEETKALLSKKKSDLSRLSKSKSTLIKRLGGDSDDNEELEIVRDELKEKAAAITSLKAEIEMLEDKLLEFTEHVNGEVVTYEEFANFFENVGVQMNNVTNHYLLDDIVRIIFANLTLDHEKVVAYQLNEPFHTYSNIGSGKHGVTNGT